MCYFILQKLKVVGLYTRMEKYILYTILVEFLEYIMSNDSLQINAKKV